MNVKSTLPEKNYVSGKDFKIPQSVRVALQLVAKLKTSDLLLFFLLMGTKLGVGC